MKSEAHIVDEIWGSDILLAMVLTKRLGGDGRDGDEQVRLAAVEIHGWIRDGCCLLGMSFLCSC